MKRLFLLIMLGFVTVMSGKAQEGFKISGKIANMPDGVVWLVGRIVQEKLDTLGHALLKDGVLEMEGYVDTDCLALLVMPDKKTGVQLMLENTDYTIKMSEDEKIEIKGGEAQELFLRFDAIKRSIAEKR